MNEWVLEYIGYWCMIFLYRQLIDNVLFVILDPKDSQMDYRNLLKHRFYILMNHIHCNSKALTLSVYLIQTEHQYKTCKFITYCTYWSVIIFFILLLLMGIFGNFFIEITRKMKRMTRTLTGGLSNQVEFPQFTCFCLLCNLYPQAKFYVHYVKNKICNLKSVRPINISQTP